jgi:hypothetical protein
MREIFFRWPNICFLLLGLFSYQFCQMMHERSSSPNGGHDKSIDRVAFTAYRSGGERQIGLGLFTSRYVLFDVIQESATYRVKSTSAAQANAIRSIRTRDTGLRSSTTERHCDQEPHRKVYSFFLLYRIKQANSVAFSPQANFTD